MIEDLHKEAYFRQNAPLVAEGNGGCTKPVNFRKRYYRILKAGGIEQRGLHSLRQYLRYQFGQWTGAGRWHDQGVIATVGG